MLAVPDSQTPQDYRTPYRVCVTRGWKPKTYEIYRLPLRDRLPAIRIPLRQSDADVALELQPLIDQAYRNGVYDDIDYTSEPYPTLNPEDAKWADALLREKQLRS